MCGGEKKRRDWVVRAKKDEGIAFMLKRERRDAKKKVQNGILTILAVIPP